MTHRNRLSGSSPAEPPGDGSGSRTGRRRSAALAAGLCVVLAACGSRQAKDDRALGLEPESSPGDVYVELASEYLRLGQLDSALRRGQQAVEEDPTNPRAPYVVAVVYQQIGQLERADQSYKRAVELAPNNADIRNAYGGFHCSRRRFSEGEAQFAKALESPLYTTPWVAQTNAGTCAAMAGNRAKAESNYRQALARNPRFGPALYKMAELEYARGNYGVAKDYLDRYFQSNESTSYALELGIRTERQLGNTKAAATYEQILKTNYPDAPQTRAP